MLGTTSSSGHFLSSSSDFLEEGNNCTSSTDKMTATNINTIPEFVKKLFGMLEENAHPHIFSWGINGDTFVVKDTNEFARNILPKHFKHSNFQSFVRQLNKYDFHKLKLPEDAQRIYGDQAWEFQHPNFKYNRKELLEGIKRKPSGKPGNSFPAANHTKGTSSHSALSSSLEEMKRFTNGLQREISELDESQKKVTSKLETFDKRYGGVLENIQSSRDTMRQQDSLMNDVMDYLKHTERTHDHHFHAKERVQQLLMSYQKLSSTTEKQLERLTDLVTSAIKTEFPRKRQKQQHQPFLTSKNSNIVSNDNLVSSLPMTNTADVLTVPTNATTSLTDSKPVSAHYVHPPPMTVKSDQPQQRLRSDSVKESTPFKNNTIASIANNDTTLKSTIATAPAPAANVVSAPMVATGSNSNNASNNSISRKRKRLQVGWTVPPRVLLVDDDSLFRRLSTRLLQIAGCTIDVAVDGMEAVRKLGIGKYDLVLMDIMMPKLDGISATRNIRQYDTWTPIISMTSNITDQDIQHYFMSGMTDILPKPFNQGSLGTLLERYCAHLVVRRQHQQQLHLLQQNLSLGNAFNQQQHLRLVEESNGENNNNEDMIHLSTAPASAEASNTNSVTQALLSTVLYSIPLMANGTSLDTSTTTPIITPMDSTTDNLTTALQNTASVSASTSNPAPTMIPQASNASTASSASALPNTNIPTNHSTTAAALLGSDQQQQWFLPQTNQHSKSMKVDITTTTAL